MGLKKMSGDLLRMSRFKTVSVQIPPSEPWSTTAYIHPWLCQHPSPTLLISHTQSPWIGCSLLCINHQPWETVKSCQKLSSPYTLGATLDLNTKRIVCEGIIQYWKSQTFPNSVMALLLFSNCTQGCLSTPGTVGGPQLDLWGLPLCQVMSPLMCLLWYVIYWGLPLHQCVCVCHILSAHNFSVSLSLEVALL